jgi:hypothetical protein
MIGSRFDNPFQKVIMSLRTLSASLLAAGLLAACGGEAPPAAPAQTRLLATAVSAVSNTFPSLRANYSITETADGYAVTDLAGNGGTTAAPRDTRLRFADTSLAFDFDGKAGTAFRLYRAAFDRWPDAAGLGYWIGLMDGGVATATVAGGFVASAEFQALYGANISNADLVGKLYQNVLHRPGEDTGIAFWTGVLDRSAATRAQVLAAFSDSAEGKAAVRDAIRGGIGYLEAGIRYVPGPIDPAPASLWKAVPEATPARGNYVYLESGQGDVVGNGRRYLYNDANARLKVSMTAGYLELSVDDGNGTEWRGEFAGMSSLKQLVRGYYAGLQRHSHEDPARGGLEWKGSGRACHDLSGWFVLDKVSFAGNRVVGLDLRFEQHCEGAAAALNGQIHWSEGGLVAPGALL